MSRPARIALVITLLIVAVLLGLLAYRGGTFVGAS